MTPVVLALVLIVTSFQVAAARGAPSPVGSMVICSGQGTVTVMVDENGAPVGQVHICPDAALALFAATSLSPTLLERPVIWSRFSVRLQKTQRFAQWTKAASARGPPLSV